jgi:hypothetical protein
LRNFAFLALSLSIAGAGCNFGGLNDNINQPGDQPGGVELSAGDIAVSPDGRFIVFERDDELAMAWVDTGKVESLPVLAPARLAFSQKRSVVYVTTDGGETHAVDVETGEELWRAEGIPGAMITASKDDAKVATGLGTEVRVFAAVDGDTVADLDLERDLVDLEILPDDARLVVVEDEEWIEEVPHAILTVVDLEDGASRKVDVENCADNLIVPVPGDVALLAPTLCAPPDAEGGFDPISHVDLTPGNEHFVKNLPGFGPVAVSPDGRTAVGFLDMEALDASLFEDPSQIPEDAVRFHLMILDVASMTYSFEAYGPNLPRYAPTPNGEVLLVDEWAGLQAELFDVESRTFREIEGLETLEQVSFASDSESAYVLTEPRWAEQEENSEKFFMEYDLMHVDVPAAKATALPTNFRPRNVNISPDDSTLFLRIDDARVCIYSLARKSCDREVVLVSSLASK